MKSTLILLASIATLALAKFETWPSGLQVEYVTVPETCDIKPLNGQMVLVHYTGISYTSTLKDGTKFASDRREIFQVGTKGMDPRRAIKVLEEAVLDMCIGEKRRLIVPPFLGLREFDNTLDYNDPFGIGGYSGIDCFDKNSIINGGFNTRYYDIELISAKDHQADDPNVFKTIDTNGDSNLSKEEISIYLEEICYPGKKELQGWIWTGFLELIFSLKDEDKNGYISHEEFSGSKHDEL